MCFELIGIISAIICLILFRPKKWLPRLLIIAGGLTLTVILVISPVKDIFMSYDTPEAAFTDTADGEIIMCVEGEETCLVVAEYDNDLSEAIVSKSNDGWKAGTAFHMRIHYWKPTAEYSLTVLRYKETGEFYIYLVDQTGQIRNISDNRNSEFTAYRSDKKTYGDAVYVAYVPDIDENYTLFIDGKGQKCMYR